MYDQHPYTVCGSCPCKIGAEFYRPMFAPLFGADVRIEPYQTVLNGADECILAIRIDGRGKRNDA